MSKLIKLKNDHYIIVDDSQINKGDYCLMFDDSGNIFLGNEPQQYLGEKAGHYLNKGLRKITHSTQSLEVIAWKGKTHLHMDEYYFDKIQKISLQEVKELIGEVNEVEELAEKAWGNSLATKGHRIGFKYGYNQALKDNKEKKYTEEDVIAIVEKSRETGLTAEYLMITFQPKSEWEVEIIDGKLKLK